MGRPLSDREFGPMNRRIREALGVGRRTFTRLIGWNDTRVGEVRQIENGDISAGPSFRERSADVLIPRAQERGIDIPRRDFVNGMGSSFLVGVLASLSATKIDDHLGGGQSPAGRPATVTKDFATLAAEIRAAEAKNAFDLSVPLAEKAELVAATLPEKLQAKATQVHGLLNLQLFKDAAQGVEDAVTLVGLEGSASMLTAAQIMRRVRDDAALKLFMQILLDTTGIYHAQGNFATTERIRSVYIDLARERGADQDIYRALRGRGAVHKDRARRLDGAAATVAREAALDEFRGVAGLLEGGDDRGHGARHIFSTLVAGGMAHLHRKEVEDTREMAREAYGKKSRAIVSLYLDEADYLQREGNGLYTKPLEAAAALALSLKSSSALSRAHYFTAVGLSQWSGRAARKEILAELATALALDAIGPTSMDAREAAELFVQYADSVGEVDFAGWIGESAELVAHVQGMPAFDEQRMRQTEASTRDLWLRRH